MKINKKSIFYDLKTTLHFLDGLIFGNSLKIIVKKTPKEYKELIVGFHPRKNLYVINKRILKRSQEKVLQRGARCGCEQYTHGIRQSREEAWTTQCRV